MDLSTIVKDSAGYAKEALIGKWVRWIIFIILSLPLALLRFVFDPKKMMIGSHMDWSAFPWGEVAVIIGVGILLSFFLSGYLVRIYRGTVPAPDFNAWGELFINGIKLDIVWLAWLIPVFVVLVLLIGIAFATMMPGSGAGMAGVSLILAIIMMILVVIVVVFGMMGAVRFARTGSMREGIRLSAISATIRSMGWLSYILALIILLVLGVIFWIITAVLELIPYIGWIFVLIIGPLFSIFAARYITLVYNEGEKQQVPAPAEVPAQ